MTPSGPHPTPPPLRATRGQGAWALQKLGQDVRQVVQDLMPYDPERVILFGSLARGDSDDYSDIDVMVIKRTETRFVQRLGCGVG